MLEGGQSFTRLKVSGSLIIQMEYQSLRERTYQIFKSTKIMEKKIDHSKREIKFLRK